MVQLRPGHNNGFLIPPGGFMPTEDMALAVRKVTARQCNRISRVAFDWARKRRKKITAVHKANSTSLILSAAMLFEWLAARHQRPEFDQAAKAIESAIDASLQAAATRTADLGGKLGTKAFAKHVISLIG